MGGSSSLTLVQRYTHVRAGRGAEALQQMHAQHETAIRTSPQSPAAVIPARRRKA
ncbi:MAG TPA: hypothetical protein VNF52_05685 [Candidatus Dormibacteraeota bacterium]|nr:hypothetical protein [Candidatus Dormibacteraeota bacterium]